VHRCDRERHVARIHVDRSRVDLALARIDEHHHAGGFVARELGGERAK
jgi:hypothetical protein